MLKEMLRCLACVVFVLLAAGCQQEGERVLGPVRAQELIRENTGRSDFIILDVRTPEEYGRGHVPGAMLMDMYSRDFKVRLGELDRGATVLVYCAVGGRSMWARQLGESMGFTHMLDMQGGFQAWVAAGLPVEK